MPARKQAEVFVLVHVLKDKRHQTDDATLTVFLDMQSAYNYCNQQRIKNRRGVLVPVREVYNVREIAPQDIDTPRVAVDGVVSAGKDTDEFLLSLEVI